MLLTKPPHHTESDGPRTVSHDEFRSERFIRSTIIAHFSPLEAHHLPKTTVEPEVTIRETTNALDICMQSTNASIVTPYFSLILNDEAKMRQQDRNWFPTKEQRAVFSDPPFSLPGTHRVRFNSSHPGLVSFFVPWPQELHRNFVLFGSIVFTSTG